MIFPKDQGKTEEHVIVHSKVLHTMSYYLLLW